MYGWSGIEFTYVDSLASDPDIVFVFAPISPSAAPVLDGYVLLSLGRAEDVGAGSVADGLSLVAPFLRSFVIPEGTYGRLTPTAVATVAVDTLLVTRADTPRIVIYDLIQALQMMGPPLVAQRPDLAIDDLEDFDISHLTFPVHPGTLAFRTRNEPGFAERAAGILEVIVACIVATGTALLALLRYLRGRRKSRIHVLYREALAVRANVSPNLSAQQRRSFVGQLRALRDRAFSLLISEKLSADESFRILQTLISDVIHELETVLRTRSGPTAPGAIALPLPRRSSAFDDADDLCDRRVRLERMPQRPVERQAVAVRAPQALARDHAGFLELPDDSLHGALGDADFACDLAHAFFGVARDADEHVRVVAEDRPLRAPGLRFVVRCGPYGAGMIRAFHDYLYRNTNTCIIFPV